MVDNIQLWENFLGEGLLANQKLLSKNCLNNSLFIYFVNLTKIFSFSLSEEWLRPVMRKDKQVLVHWGFYPDR